MLAFCRLLNSNRWYYPSWWLLIETISFCFSSCRVEFIPIYSYGRKHVKRRALRGGEESASPKGHKSLVYNDGLRGTRVRASELCRADEWNSLTNAFCSVGRQAGRQAGAPLVWPSRSGLSSSRRAAPRRCRLSSLVFPASRRERGWRQGEGCRYRHKQ